MFPEEMLDSVIRFHPFEGNKTLREMLDAEVPEKYHKCEYETNTLGELTSFTLWTKNYIVVSERTHYGLYPNIIEKEKDDGCD